MSLGIDLLGFFIVSSSLAVVGNPQGLVLESVSSCFSSSCFPLPILYPLQIISFVHACMLNWYYLAFPVIALVVGLEAFLSPPPAPSLFSKLVVDVVYYTRKRGFLRNRDSRVML